MTRRSNRTAITALVIALVAVAACSDDEESSEDPAPYIDALATQLSTRDACETTGPHSSTEAVCIAEGVVEALGADFLVDSEVTPEQFGAATGVPVTELGLSEEQAVEAAEATWACDIDLGRFFAGPNAAETVRACVDESIDRDALVQADAARYQGNAALTAERYTEALLPVSACAVGG